MKNGVDTTKSYLKGIMEDVYYNLYIEKLNQKMQMQLADKSCSGMLDSEIANKFPQQTSFYTDQGNNYQQPYHDVSFNVVNSEASFQLTSPPKIQISQNDKKLMIN